MRRSPRHRSGRSPRGRGTAWAGRSPRRPVTPGSGRRRGPDRKSTRLNSSHANISYAVFCLKKKKKKTRVTHREVSVAEDTRSVRTKGKNAIVRQGVRFVKMRRVCVATCTSEQVVTDADIYD